MDFIFMLTRDDQTVEDCLAVADEISDLPLTDVGFKDVGVDEATLHKLHDRLRRQGVRTYLEVVSTTMTTALTSARIARDLNVDWLMGGTWVPQTLDVLAGSPVQYLPFPGDPRGHPTVLHGDAARITRDTAAFHEAGAAGVDLLAYRAHDADPLELVRAARAATSGRLVVAGSITTPQQLHDIAAAGADAFTIGQAALAGAFNPRRGTLRSQLADILAVTAAASTAPSKGSR